MSTQDVIVGCLDNKYLKVTEDGLVYSFRANKYLGSSSIRGYRVCTLHYLGLRKQVKVHQIVWIAFNGRIPKGLAIDHINRDGKDNRLVNLRLANPTLNSRNRRDYSGEANPAVKLKLGQVNQIRNKYASGLSYGKLASMFNVSKSLIAAIIRREVWN